MATFAGRCAYKLRKQHSCANLITVFIHTNGFNPAEPQYAQNFTCKLPTATNSNMVLIKYALAALEAIYQGGYLYKKAGVLVSEIVPEGQVQGSLFDRTDHAKHDAIMQTLDRINLKYGQNTVKVAAQGSGDAWKLRQEKLSPCFTTRWSDIITIKV